MLQLTAEAAFCYISPIAEARRGRIGQSQSAFTH
jgi:hypothetical protein